MRKVKWQGSSQNHKTCFIWIVQHRIFQCTLYTHNTSWFIQYILHLELWCIDCVTSAYICQDGRGRLLTHVTNYCEEDKNPRFRLFLLQNLTMRTLGHFILVAYWCHVANRPLLPARSPSGPWADSQPLDHCRDHQIFAPSCHTCFSNALLNWMFRD